MKHGLKHLLIILFAIAALGYTSQVSDAATQTSIKIEKHKLKHHAIEITHTYFQDAIILPSASNLSYSYKLRTLLLGLCLAFLLLITLSASEKHQLLWQPTAHFSSKLVYLLYPFHGFW